MKNEDRIKVIVAVVIQVEFRNFVFIHYFNHIF